MVPKAGKSKRQKASKQYSVKKKITEHHRKQRKEARKNPTQRKTVKKDPGVPNLFPFKEKMLQQAEDAKRKAEQEKLLAKQARKAGLTTDQMALASLAQKASSRGMSFESTLATSPAVISGGSRSSSSGTISEAAVSGRKDNSRKAYYREFKKVIEQADVILEVLDARDPLGCRTRQIEELILNAGANKRIVLVLNKIDLVPRENVEQWLKYLRNEFPTVAFKASTQNQRANLGQSNVSTQLASDALLSSSESLGADNLVKLLKNYCRNLNIKTSITVGVVGFPNVGKSSVINSLKRSKACNVGATPGVTKVTQTINLDKNIKLLDCPGIVFSRSDNGEDDAQVLLRNCVKVELLEDPIAPVDLIVSRCKKEQLIQLYNVPYFSDTTDFLVHIARTRGRLRRGGVPDIDSAARAIIQDWNNGRIPFYTIPPAVESHVSSAIVNTWSTEFSLPDVVAAETDEVLQHVKSKIAIPTRMFAIEDAGSVPVDMAVERLPSGYNDVDHVDDEESMEEDSDEDDDEEEDEDLDGMDQDDEDDDEEKDDEADDEDRMDEDRETAANVAALAAMQASKRAAAPEIRFKPVVSAKLSKSAAAKRVDRSNGLSMAEVALNPQTNQLLRKNQKQMKRNQRKASRKSASAEDDEDME